MKMKQWHFDVEYIHDMEINVLGEITNVADHKMFRNLTIQQVCELVRNNMIPIEEKSNITLNIRGVTH